MSRQPKGAGQARPQASHDSETAPEVQERPDGTKVEVLGNRPLEPMPEVPGHMTEAAAAALDEPSDKGDAKAVAAARKAPEPVATREVRRYEVLQTTAIMGANGFRGQMRAGKIIDNVQYNIEKLKSQGVKLAPLQE